MPTFIGRPKNYLMPFFFLQKQLFRFHPRLTHLTPDRVQSGVSHNFLNALTSREDAIIKLRCKKMVLEHEILDLKLTKSYLALIKVVIPIQVDNLSHYIRQNISFYNDQRLL